MAVLTSCRPSLSSPALPSIPTSFRPGQAGFTKSNTTATGCRSVRTATEYVFLHVAVSTGPNVSAHRAASLKFKATSFSMDGEMVCVDDNGLADFAKLHSRCFDDEAIFHAFDLMELAGEDLKPLPLIERQTRLRKLIHRPTGIHTSTMTPMAVPISSAPPASTVSKASSQSALEAATSPARSAASHGARLR